MLRKALPFLVYIIVVRGEVSVRLEDVIRTISVVKAEQLLQHRAFFFSLSLPFAIFQKMHLQNKMDSLQLLQNCPQNL